MSTPETEGATPMETKAELAEQIATLVGWKPARGSEREKALSELWCRWAAQSPGVAPRNHPELSDERIRDLAADYDDRQETAMEKFRELVGEHPR